MGTQGQAWFLALVSACLVGGLYAAYGDRVAARMRAIFTRIKLYVK